MYDAAGRAVSIIDANGRVKTMAYNAVGEQLNTAYADGTRLTFAYDVLGRTTTMQDSGNHHLCVLFTNGGSWDSGNGCDYWNWTYRCRQ